MSIESSKTIKRRGLIKKHANVDHEVWQWKIHQEQVKGSRVTKAEVQAYAVQAYHHAGILNFKASDGWYRRWRVRWQQISNCSSAIQQIQEGGSGNCGPFLETNVEKSLISVGTETASEIHEQIKNKYLNAEQNESDGRIILLLGSTEMNIVESQCPIEESCSQEELQIFNCDVVSEKGEELPPDPPLFSSNLLTTNKSVSVFETKQCIVDSTKAQVEKKQENVGEGVYQGIQNSEPRTECLVIHAEELTPNNEQSDTASDIFTKTVGEVVVSSLNEPVLTGIELPLTPPSSSGSFDVYYSSPSLIYQNDFDFGDELFCDTCDDFHPRHQGSLFECQKRVKRTEDKLLLSGVNRGKDSLAGGFQEVLQEEDNKKEDHRFVNPGIQKIKGKRYLDQFKNQVVTYALTHTAKMAASKFKINRGTVCDWLCQHRKNNITEPKIIISNENGKPSDTEFLRWLEDSKFNLTNDRIKQKTTKWLTSAGVDKSSQWLRMYAHRLHGSKSSIKKRYIAYPDLFKKVAVFHAQTHSNMAAARVFGVARRRIIEWQATTGASKSSEEKLERFPRVTDASVDRDLFTWYSAQHPTPSAHQVRSKACALYAAAGRPLGCGAGWYYRWRARHKLPPARQTPSTSAHCRLLSWALTTLEQTGLTHRSLADQAIELGIPEVTKIWSARFCRKHKNVLKEPPQLSAKLPADLERAARDFKIALGPALDLAASSRVVSMHPTLLHFIPAEQRLKKSVLWRPPARSALASVVISCSANGTLLPSLLVLKGGELPAISGPEVLCTSSNTGIMNEEIFLMWINDVFMNHLGNEGGVLVTNSLPLLSCDAGSRLLESHGVRHAAAPSGTARRLAPALPVANMFRSIIEELGLASLEGQQSPLFNPSADQLLQWTQEVHNYVAKACRNDIKSAFQEMLFVKNDETAAEPD